MSTRKKKTRRTIARPKPLVSVVDVPMKNLIKALVKLSYRNHKVRRKTAGILLT